MTGQAYYGSLGTREMKERGIGLRADPVGKRVVTVIYTVTFNVSLVVTDVTNGDDQLSFDGLFYSRTVMNVRLDNTHGYC